MEKTFDIISLLYKLRGYEMSDAQEMYEHAMQQTGIDDPANALDSLIDSYGREEEEDEEYEVEDSLSEYNIGNTVRLQSGGPLMTIKEIKNNILICRWFDKNQLCSETFNTSEIYLDGINQKINTQDNDIKQATVPIIDIDEDEIPF